MLKKCLTSQERPKSALYLRLKKIEGGAFWRQKKFANKSHSAGKTRKGDPSLSSGSVGYAKKVKTKGGPFGDKKSFDKKVAQCRKKIEGGTLQSRPVLYITF